MSVAGWRLATPAPRGSRVALGRRGCDLVVPATAIGLALLGLVVVASATRGSGASSGFAVRQALWVSLGVAVMGATMAVDLPRLRRLAPLAWVLAAGALVAVLSPLGLRTNGAQAWFGAGPFRIQPAELVKPVLVVVLAAHAARGRGPLSGGRLLGGLVLAGPLIGLVLLQPDLGTAAVLVAVTATFAFTAGARTAHLAVVALMAVLAVAGVVRAGVLAPYQVDRLTSFLEQGDDPGGAGWNLQQAKIAIGSGGLSGVGPFAGKQTGLGYVPERHTDFVFTVVGEEFGLAGGLSVVGLFAILAWRTWRAAWRAPDVFGALCCAGVLAMLVCQVTENVGMAMGVMPITGIPLPFVSYGGSALIAAFASVGLVANVSRSSRSGRAWHDR